jgi:hypothetical protein
MGEKERKELTHKSITNNVRTSGKAILNEQKTNHSVKTNNGQQKCSVSIDPNTSLVVPLTLKVAEVKLGTNIIAINKNICSMSDFGDIKSPKTIRFSCNKALLHINPYK